MFQVQRCPPPHQQGKKDIESKRRTGLFQTNSSFKTLSHITVHKRKGFGRLQQIYNYKERHGRKKGGKNTKLLSENRTESITLENQNKNIIPTFGGCYYRLDKAFSGFHLVMSGIINILVPNEPKCTKKRFCVISCVLKTN